MCPNLCVTGSTVPVTEKINAAYTQTDKSTRGLKHYHLKKIIISNNLGLNSEMKDVLINEQDGDICK